MLNKEILDEINEAISSNDPYIKEYIKDLIREELLNTHEPSQPKKRGRNTKQETLRAAKYNQGWRNFQIEEADQAEDYEAEQQGEGKQYIAILPQRFEVIGHHRQKKGRVLPIFRMSDLYLSSNPKVKHIVSRIFQRNIYGAKRERPKEPIDKTVTVSRGISNYQQLEAIMKEFDDREDAFSQNKMNVQYNEEWLQEYVVDRAQSKEDYFLYYKQTKPIQQQYLPKNNPLLSTNFLKDFRRQVYDIERQYQKIQEEEDSEAEEKLKQKKEREAMIPQPKQDSIEAKPKEYFGQFIKEKKKIAQTQPILAESSVDSSALATSILNYYSYVDPQIQQQQYLKPIQQNNQLMLNLANPQFFLPKLHIVLDRSNKIKEEQQKFAQMQQMKKNGNAQQTYSRISGSMLTGNKMQLGKHLSAMGSQLPQFHVNTEPTQSIEYIIEQQQKNVYRQPIKHSEAASKFELIKFTLEQNSFQNYHRYDFPFHQHLNSGRVRVEPIIHRPLKNKENMLVLNVEMKESNSKFAKKQDLSLSKGQFILVEYLEETPLLMSNVGMCQRMFVQVNHTQIMEKIKQDIISDQINKVDIDELQNKRDKNISNTQLDFEKQCALWRKNIRQTFGQNGKQFFWKTSNSGKLIGAPDGPGVIVMESNLMAIPLVKKKNNPRDFLLVREGKKWFLRRIDHIYISGQVQPKIKVFCPGSRDHSIFKICYEKAFIRKQIKEYGSVNFDQLKLTFKGQTESSLRKALKSLNTVSKDGKNYKLLNEASISEFQLSPEDVCLYERMQKSLCMLRQVGIVQIKSNQKMKNVLKEFNKKHCQDPQKFAIARMIREQLQLTSWYLTDSFLKYKQKTSKIQIHGFADPTNGKGGYSYINKPQKERTAKQDMEQKVDKQKIADAIKDLRKLNCNQSRELLRNMGHNEDEIESKGRWQLIKFLKNKQGTEYSRKERQTKLRKMQNQKKQISKTFNHLLKYLNDELEEPAFDYSRRKKTNLEYYMEKQRQNWEKTKNKYLRAEFIKEDADSNEDSDGDDVD